MSKPSIELDVVLIHNNSSERVSAMHVVCDTLKNSAPSGISVHFADEVSWQPNILTSSFVDRVRWALANSRTQYLFSRAKLKAAPLSLLRSSLAGTMSFCAYFAQEIRDAIGKRQFSSRHRQVSRKHSVAWKQFLTSSSSDWLLVLEDDALFTKAGPEGLWRILRETETWPSNIPSYILVSEGLDLGVLRLKSQDFSAVSSQLRSPRFPFANTAAAYLINRSLAAHFVKTLQEKPGLADNTIDFLLNNLMLRLFLKSGSSEISCHHSTFPPFQNASINGMYSSLLST